MTEALATSPKRQRKLRITKVAPELPPLQRRFRKPHLPEGTIVGGFRIVSYWGWDISRRTLYLSACLICGKQAPRTTSNMKRTIGCQDCAAARRPAPNRLDYRRLPKSEPKRQSVPGPYWIGWVDRCMAVLEVFTVPLQTEDLLRLIRSVAASRYEQFAARQWLAAGESLGLWEWQSGLWYPRRH